MKVIFTEDGKVSKSFSSFEDMMSYLQACEPFLDLYEDLEKDAIYVHSDDYNFEDIKYADILWN